MVNKIISNPEIRKYIYRIGMALAAVLIGYGVLTIDEAGLWVALFGAVLGFNEFMASVNTKESEELYDVEEDDFTDELIDLE